MIYNSDILFFLEQAPVYSLQQPVKTKNGTILPYSKLPFYASRQRNFTYN